MYPILDNHQRILISAILFLVLLWALERFFLVKLSGNTKRGFKIWSKPLSSKLREYLTNLSENVISPYKFNFQTVYSFIQVESNEAIVYSFHPALFLCVGYVNLIQPNAKLEYRGGVSHFLVFLLAIAYGFYLVIPIFALILVFNYWMEIRIIDRYLNKRSIYN